MSEISRIDVLDDGPLEAEGIDKLGNSKCDELEIRKKVALCRCGALENKPYCDGSHKRIGISSRVERGLPIIFADAGRPPTSPFATARIRL